MTTQGNIADKKRVMHDAIVLDTSNVPAFPTAPTNKKMLFKGDFTGAEILGIEWIVSGTFDLTTLDGKLQHSDDGVVWYDVDATNLAFTQLAANGSEWLPIPDDVPSMKKYLRFALTAGTSGTTTNVKLIIGYNQVRAPGRLAYAGHLDRSE